MVRDGPVSVHEQGSSVSMTVADLMDIAGVSLDQRNNDDPTRQGVY
jgi:L-serine deaminase